MKLTVLFLLLISCYPVQSQVRIDTLRSATYDHRDSLRQKRTTARSYTGMKLLLSEKTEWRHNGNYKFIVISRYPANDTMPLYDSCRYMRNGIKKIHMKEYEYVSMS